MRALEIAAVIPTHDRAEPVVAAVESVLAQTVPPSRVVVVDDGSSDGTAERMRRLFPDVHLVVQENRGVSAARNRGVARCHEPWIAFLASDDTWLPEKLERQTGAVEERRARGGDPTLVHTDEVWIRTGNQVLQRRRHAKRGGRIFEQSLGLCAISPSAVMLRRDLFEELGGFDEDLPACEDYDLWLRWTARWDVELVDEELVRKTGGHDDQLSRRHPVMDRFRIRSLHRLLRGAERAHLSERELARALETLEEKTAIVAGGARRRGRDAEAEALESELERTRELLAP